MGANIKEFLRLVEDFVNMIGMQMSGFQDIHEVTENLGEPLISLPAALCSCIVRIRCALLTQRVHQS